MSSCLCPLPYTCVQPLLSWTQLDKQQYLTVKEYMSAVRDGRAEFFLTPRRLPLGLTRGQAALRD